MTVKAGWKVRVAAGLVLPVLLLTAATALAGDHLFWARVVKVTDGDTIVVVRKNDRLDLASIRLYGVDAPEGKQPYGKAAARHLKRMIDKKIVLVEVMQKRDRYGRIVAVIRHEGKDVNRELLEGGSAWVYHQYCKKKKPCRGYWAAVRRAEKAKLGLWKNKNPVPPWEWRGKTDDD